MELGPANPEVGEVHTLYIAHNLHVTAPAGGSVALTAGWILFHLICSVDHGDPASFSIWSDQKVLLQSLSRHPNILVIHSIYVQNTLYQTVKAR